MRALLRILVVIPLGYVAACIAAGVVFALSLYGFVRESDPVVQGVAIGFAFAMSAYAGALAAAPMLAAIILAEAFGWRSFFWSLFGGLLGLAGKALQENPEGVQTPGIVALYAVAGLVAGAVYWLVAGRSSGLFATRRALPG